MLDKKYNPSEVEKNKYSFWKEKEYFKSGDLSKEPFCIVIPPPNITGTLHLGHALNNSVQDAIIRYKRMQGFDCLWLPGMDHAAIATEAKVVNKLKNEGIDKYELGRDDFLKECWKWSNDHKNLIHKQWETLGVSVDYSKERFTLDEGLNHAVNTVFIDLYNKGMIYRGEKIINWDPIAQTALSNEEVIYQEDKSKLYYLKYHFEDKKGFITVATTRPETIFGDVAVAVNPNDPKNKDLIGKKVYVPIVNRLVPIIGDELVLIDFGTGALKITPAHAPDDFIIGEKHNLEIINCLNPNATLNKYGMHYEGKSAELARKEIEQELKEKDFIVKIEDYLHTVGHSERTNAVVEPYLSKQWFVNMEKMAKDLLNNQKTSNKVEFFPKRFEKILNHWMKNCHDWCISRQLWWGHRIPAWYKDDQIFVGDTPPNEEWIQDNDVLDTWFSSALWPFSTLGWPDKTPDLERYFPTDVLVTAYDIIFFWVARMMFSSLEQMNNRPFKDCIIHGLIRDKNGRKMSKSLGNGINPMDIIEEYGTDSLRHYLSTCGAMGQDIKFDQEKVSSTWNFINKLWNASRFVLMNLDNNYEISNQELALTDKWILTKLNKTIKNVTKHMDKYEFNLAGEVLYSFIWDDFCDNYIELSKNNLDKASTKSILSKVLTNILKMLHPFMPYVTEEIYQKLPTHEESIMISSYPKYQKEEIFNEEEILIDKLIEELTLIRNFKVANNIEKDAFINIKTEDRLLDIFITGLKIKKDNLCETKEGFETYNYTSNLINISFFIEKAKLNKEILEKEIKELEQIINKRKNLLNNENYIKKAPSHIVELDKQKLNEEESKLRNLKNMI